MTNAVKQFITAAEEADEGVSLDLTHPFSLGKKDYKARLPTPSEVAIWMVATANGDRAAYDETIRFMQAVLHDSTWDDEDGNLLVKKAPEDFDPDEQARTLFHEWRNPRSKVEVDDCIPVVRWLIEERATFPTTSSSGSTSGQPKRGQSSTRAGSPKASTRARSSSAASAG